MKMDSEKMALHRTIEPITRLRLNIEEAHTVGSRKGVWAINEWEVDRPVGMECVLYADVGNSGCEIEGIALYRPAVVILDRKRYYGSGLHRVYGEGNDGVRFLGADRLDDFNRLCGNGVVTDSRNDAHEVADNVGTGGAKLREEMREHIIVGAPSAQVHQPFQAAVNEPAVTVGGFGNIAEDIQHLGAVAHIGSLDHRGETVPVNALRPHLK